MFPKLLNEVERGEMPPRYRCDQIQGRNRTPAGTDDWGPGKASWQRIRNWLYRPFPDIRPGIWNPIIRRRV